MTENIGRKLLVLSGKGGVGKSTIAVNLAAWLASRGSRVGLLDIDIHGPSIPKLLGLDNQRLRAENDRIQPVVHSTGMKVMSIGFMLQNENEALIWRGPMKHNVIKQFTGDVDWGELDYLVVDCPPGTGDEALSIAQLLNGIDGAVVVTTPQDIAVADVRKCITFCRQLNLPVLGVIENMSGFICPHCNERTDIFPTGGGQRMAEQFDVPYLGGIPIEPGLAGACDCGKPFLMLEDSNETSQALSHAFEGLLEPDRETENSTKEKKTMRIAIPLTNGMLSMHFGHCEQFEIVDVDRDSAKIIAREIVQPPPHEPGALPRWLSGLQVELIISGGMGTRAKQLFADSGIEVVVGAPEETSEQLVLQYLAGRLECGPNICDH